MLIRLTDAILSLCFSFLNLNSLLKSKQVNKICNNNIKNNATSWMVPQYIWIVLI